MKTLSAGKSPDCILSLIKVILTMQQADYHAAVEGDTTQLQDIADELAVEKPLFKVEDCEKFETQQKQMSANLLQDDPHNFYKQTDLALNLQGPMFIVPSSVEKGISSGSTLNTGYTGKRSAMFDHLLEQEL